MKIALYVPSWPAGFAANGIVTYASYLVPALRALGHEVFVLTWRKMSEHDDPYTIDLGRFAPSASLWHRAASKLVPEWALNKAAPGVILSAVKELVSRHQIDVFEIEESFGWSFAISRLNVLPVVVRLHGPWFLNGRFSDPNHNRSVSARREKMEGRAICDAHYVTSPAAEVLSAVEHRYGLELKRSSIIANPMPSAELSAIWNVGGCNPHTFIFVGRFNSRKGGDLVLRAFATLSQVCPKVRLTFIGPDDGVVTENGKVTHFEEFVRGNVPEQCRAHIDFRSQMKHSEVMSCRRTHLATIIASQYEIAPYSVLEAISFGCPIITTAVGGIPEIIKDDLNGLIVPSQDTKAMADACRRLLTDQSLTTRLGQEAWQTCRKLYDPKNIAKQVLAAYQHAIDNFKSRY